MFGDLMQKVKLQKVAFVSLAITLILVAYYAGTLNSAMIVQVHEQPRIAGRLRVWLKRADWSNWVLITDHHNLIVTNGLKYVRNLLGFNNVTSMNQTVYISLSNDATPDSTWTKLPNEITTSGLSRSGPDATYPQVINATAYTTKTTFTCTADGVAVQCAGLHYDPTSDSDGNLYAASTFDPTTLYTNDQLALQWDINQKAGST